MTQNANQDLNIAKQNTIAKAKKLIISEGNVLFVGLSIFAGASAFFEITAGSLQVSSITLRWAAIAITIMRLPDVFSTVHKGNDPFLIRFAKGFRDGFLGVQLLAPSLYQWIIRAKEFITILREPVKD